MVLQVRGDDSLTHSGGGDSDGEVMMNKSAPGHKEWKEFYN